jgi:hypothetical protein
MGVIVRLGLVLGGEVHMWVVGVALVSVAVLVMVMERQVLEPAFVGEEVVGHVEVPVIVSHGLMGMGGVAVLVMLVVSVVLGGFGHLASGLSRSTVK